MALMSQRAYARHRAELGLPGITHTAIQKAIAAGRIKVDAQGLIDSDAADRAWAANSSEGHRRNSKQDEAAKGKAKAGPPANAKPAPKAPRARATPSPPPALPPLPPPPPVLPAAPALPRGGPGEITVTEATAAEKYWKAQLAELDFYERSGKLVPAEEVVAKWVEIVTISKTKLLAVPSKLKGRIPKLTAADVGMIDELIREALEELAKGDDVEEEDAHAR